MVENKNVSRYITEEKIGDKNVNLLNELTINCNVVLKSTDREDLDPNN